MVWYCKDCSNMREFTQGGHYVNRIRQYESADFNIDEFGDASDSESTGNIFNDELIEIEEEVCDGEVTCSNCGHDASWFDSEEDRDSWIRDNEEPIDRTPKIVSGTIFDLKNKYVGGNDEI